MEIQRYIPTWDQSINEGTGGWRCGAPSCGSPYWVDTNTHASCENGHEVDPVALDDLYDDELG